MSEAKIEQRPLLTCIEVQMDEVVGEYETPDDVPECLWVEQNASFGHRDNGEAGVWEFLVNLARDFDDVPVRLRATLDEARSLRVDYVFFHQGT